MSGTALITLTANRSLATSLEIKVLADGSADREGGLTLSVRSGFFAEGAAHERKLDADEASGLLALLDDFELRGTRGVTGGLDGTTYSLRIETYPLEISLEWWELPPAGWSGPAELISELISLAGSEAEEFRRW